MSETSKTESPKPKKSEAPKTESPKTKKSEAPAKSPAKEGAKQEGAKQQAPKEAAKEAPKQEAKKEAPKEAPKQEAKKEAPKQEAKKEAPKQEAKKEVKASPKVQEAPKKKEKPKQEPPKKKEKPKVAPTPKKDKPKGPPPKKPVPKKEEKPVEKKLIVPAPESYLKKRKRNQELQEKAKKQRLETVQKNKEKRQLIFKRAEQYIREYRAKERSLIHFRRTAKQAGNFFLEPEPKLALVIRIRGTMGLHPKPRKILQLLRLRQIHNATFVRLTGATKQMLRLIEPYVTYGTPNLKTVRELIYKRGFAKVNRQRIPITDNSIIEAALGKHGIICVEDLIHEIFTVGPNFKSANRFLWSFKLNPPRGGYKTIKRHYNEGGDFGDREDKINSLVRRMN
jgi:large subunit ribosomal protein L7e